jgi:hypothetical protein
VGRHSLQTRPGQNQGVTTGTTRTTLKQLCVWQQEIWAAQFQGVAVPQPEAGRDADVWIEAPAVADGLNVIGPHSVAVDSFDRVTAPIGARDAIPRPRGDVDAHQISTKTGALPSASTSSRAAQTRRRSAIGERQMLPMHTCRIEKSRNRISDGHSTSERTGLYPEMSQQAPRPKPRQKNTPRAPSSARWHRGWARHDPRL